MTDEEKKIVAYHEIGHALVAAMQTHPPRAEDYDCAAHLRRAGRTMQVEEGNHYLMSKTEMEKQDCH